MLKNFVLSSLLLLSTLLFSLAAFADEPTKHSSNVETITIFYTPDKPANTFVPDEALGAGVDGLEHGEINQVYTKANIKAMLSAGFKPLTYRLRTELGGKAWHWNPKGEWSDPGNKQGYWTSASTSDKPILISYGYHLPRRGNTTDQANDDNYSRLDDGDPKSFWKSNPYLDQHYTGTNNRFHPQWVIIDLEKPHPINTIKLHWAVPYAIEYEIQYLQGPDPRFNIFEHNYRSGYNWMTFPGGKIQNGKGGNVTLRLSDKPLYTRFVRILLTQSANTFPSGSNDIRDSLGYAIHEIYLGTQNSKGKLIDIIRHAKKADLQTVMYVSSTDPWHKFSDIDLNTEQPGFDRVFQSGLANNKPILMPVPIIYDTPDNAAAEIKFLRSRHYAVQQIEMGEEPDGQYITPEDYAALYIQWADAIHQIDPTLQLGGPGFQTNTDGYVSWPDESGNTSWVNRFLNYLQKKQHINDFNFFSFEWYPFDEVNVRNPSTQLIAAPDMMRKILLSLQKNGLSSSIPWYLTEYGYSVFASQTEMELAGALLNAEIVAQFLTLGGNRAYFYGYEPNELIQEKDTSWGNLMLFLADDNHHIKARNATYWGARLLTQEWVKPGKGLHALYPALSNMQNAKGQSTVTAYAVNRPDGKWAVLIINKDPKQTKEVRVQFHVVASEDVKTLKKLKGPIELIQYSQTQYRWHPNKSLGYAKPNIPPAYKIVETDELILLPASSLTIVRAADLIS